MKAPAKTASSKRRQTSYPKIVLSFTFPKTFGCFREIVWEKANVRTAMPGARANDSSAVTPGTSPLPLLVVDAKADGPPSGPWLIDFFAGSVWLGKQA